MIPRGADLLRRYLFHAMAVVSFNGPWVYYNAIVPIPYFNPFSAPVNRTLEPSTCFCKGIRPVPDKKQDPANSQGPVLINGLERRYFQSVNPTTVASQPLIGIEGSI